MFFMEVIKQFSQIKKTYKERDTICILCPVSFPACFVISFDLQGL
jgi:hypothetical protein